MTIDVTPVNDAPEAINSAVIGQEDTQYIFSWAELQITDSDSNSLSVVINSLPTEGFLQYDDGLNWIAVTLGQVISKADIEAGKFCFGPEANAAGYDGYAAVGTGNLKLDYASFTYQGFDGELLSNQVTMTIDIVPVADIPRLAFASPGGLYGATSELVQTSWESVSNRNQIGRAHV